MYPGAAFLEIEAQKALFSCLG